jgi:hypothetical protein
MREHIERVLADNDPEGAEYILCWVAWMVQNPGKPAEAALVLRGGKGSGKGTFTKALLKMLVPYGMQISDQEQLTGKFNAHMQQCVLLVADEAYWAGDKRAEGALKRLITEPTLFIEPKGVNAFQVKNQLHLIMTANDEWVVPASADERRYAVFNVSEGETGNIVYFKALNAEIENGGAAAMLHELLHKPLGNWHPRQIYRNAALRMQQAQSLRGFDGFLEHVLQEGMIPGADQKRPYRVTFDNLVRAARKADPSLARMSEKAFAERCDSFGITRARNNTGALREFPPLPEARKRFEAKYRGWTWHNDYDHWIAVDEAAVLMNRPGQLV